jgi:hypothetical protein
MEIKQFINIFNPISNFNYLRYSVGIAMLFNGFPLVFFIRDTLKIGPASNIFTAIFFVLALILMLPTHLFIRIYKPNFNLLKYSVGFLLLIFYHFFAFNTSGADWLIEFGNIFFTLAFIFLLLHVPNEAYSTLIPVFFALSFFSNLTLVYSLMTNPNWKLGMRAAVTFENTNAQEGGNPHITARNALVCIMTALLLAWNYKNLLLRLFFYFSVIFSLGVIVLAQVKSSMLAIGMMMGLFLVFNAKFSSVVKVTSSIFSIRTLLILVFFYLTFQLVISRYGDLYGLVLSYWDNGMDKIIDIFYTAFGIKFTENASVDASAQYRVTSFTYFGMALKDPPLLLFGNGYKASFLDVPIIESLLNHGLLGFILFGGFNLYLLIYTFKEIRKPTNMLSTFLAYFFVYFIVLLVSNGRPYDVSFWFPYALMIRFLGIKYLDYSKTTDFSKQPIAIPPAKGARVA